MNNVQEKYAIHRCLFLCHHPALVRTWTSQHRYIHDETWRRKINLSSSLLITWSQMPRQVNEYLFKRLCFRCILFLILPVYTEPWLFQMMNMHFNSVSYCAVIAETGQTAIPEQKRQETMSKSLFIAAIFNTAISLSGQPWRNSLAGFQVTSEI